MLCERCNAREATVHKTKIVNGIKEEAHLCEVCESEIFNFEDNFSTQFPVRFTGWKYSTKYNYYRWPDKCPQCGSTYSDFKRTGKLGCGVYVIPHSGDMLAPLIKNSG